jgi:putative PIN family toxin of toxin-antitoxin system
MIRVVLDTNIIISAVLQPLGIPARIFLLAIGGSIQMCASGETFTEYEEVIRRARFGLNESTVTSILGCIRQQG